MSRLDDLAKAWDDISHGPCFPFKITDRFDSNRIEDCHGNVVIEQPDIWLPEAAEYLVMAGNELPKLLAEVKAAMAWLACVQHRGYLEQDWNACEAFRRLVEQHATEGGPTLSGRAEGSGDV